MSQWCKASCRICQPNYDLNNGKIFDLLPLRARNAAARIEQDLCESYPVLLPYFLFQNARTAMRTAPLGQRVANAPKTRYGCRRIAAVHVVNAA